MRRRSIRSTARNSEASTRRPRPATGTVAGGSSARPALALDPPATVPVAGRGRRVLASEFLAVLRIERLRIPHRRFLRDVEVVGHELRFGVLAREIVRDLSR